jgi:hypothetical protein
MRPIDQFLVLAGAKVAAAATGAARPAGVRVVAAWCMCGHRVIAIGSQKHP